MAKVNLRKSTNFITKVFQSDCIAVSKETPMKRLQNIAWPSESLAQLGPIAVGECKRSMFYKVLGVTPTEPMNVHGRGICDAGLMYEDYHIEKFKKVHMLIDEQVPISFTIPDSTNNVKIAGRMDAIVEYEGKRKVIEMKSVSAYKAPSTMGNSKTLGLPAVKNLMQAMLYKYYTSQTEEGKKLNVDEVYLMYINRSDGSTFYYKVNLDEYGYAVITKYSQSGKEGETIHLKDIKSFSELLSEPGICDKNEARVAELRVRIQDIFSKFNLVYDYAKQEMLPEPDYTHIYTPKQLDQEFKLGRISKIKYNKASKGESVGDYQCKYCPFLTKCLSDSGIRTK